MADPFIGEMRMISWNYPPRYWAFCDGSLLSISTNQALFSLLGTQYGGNGTTTFALPDLRARAPMGVSTLTPIASTSGAPSQTVALAQYPQHTHQLFGTATAGTTGQPSAGAYLASYEQAFGPVSTTTNTSMEPSDIGAAGSNQPHENRQPYLCINFVIALSGLFPSRN